MDSMPAIIEYLLKCSLSLSLIFLFYLVFLRRLTFYNWNRVYLLCYTFFSFFIPLININPLVEKQEFRGLKLNEYIPAIGNYSGRWVNLASAPSRVHLLNGWIILLTLLIAGSMIMLGRLLLQLRSLGRMKKKAIVQDETEGRVYQVDEPIIPFSFGKAIYLNKALHSEPEIREIIVHEFIHIKQRHTLDILFAELLCIVNWYNPFAWLIRYAIRQNLEFIADNQVLEQGLDKRGYQYHLLRVVGTPIYRIANSFNLSALKKRITMMNAMKSTKLHLLKFMFVLPLLAILLVAFRDRYPSYFKGHSGPDFDIEVGIVIDGGTTEPLADVLVRDSISDLLTLTDKRGFFRLKIPMVNPERKVMLKAEKRGYENMQYSSENFPIQKWGHGISCVQVLALNKANHPKPFFLFLPTGREQRQTNEYRDPGYPEAFQLYHDLQVEILGMRWLMDFQTRPGILDLYNSEDHSRHIVFLKNGEIEKYGFSNGPSVAEMASKYGPLPKFVTRTDRGVGKYYLEQWEKLSAKTAQVFHSDNPAVREMLFPGDSRVIVLLKDGSRPKVYDMDSGAPNERQDFEKNYGKLPDFVPLPPGGREAIWDPKGKPNAGNNKEKVVVIPPNLENQKKHTQVSFHGIPDKVLILVDGVEISRDSLLQLNPQDIKSINVFKNEDALKKYGNKGAEGVILINTKFQENLEPKSKTMDSSVGIHPYAVPPTYAQNSILQTSYRSDSGRDYDYRDDVQVENGIMNWRLKKDYHGHPLYLVDGKVIGKDEGQIPVKQNEIYITEFASKGNILRKYGEEGKDGIVNMVSRSNMGKRSAYIFSKENTNDPEKMKQMKDEAISLNVLFKGVENPLKISAQGISPSALVVTMNADEGEIKNKNGFYYAIPKLVGNTIIKVFEKQKDGRLLLLNSRFFRIAEKPAS